jgi:hypothetical protein
MFRNSCEGVVEMQAIMWFAQGCRHGTMLWQKLQRDMSTTLAETIRITDSYALGDPTQPTLDSQGQGQNQRNNNNAGGFGQFYRPDNRNKRRDDRQDYRYGSAQVVAIEEEQGGTGSSQCPRYESVALPKEERVGEQECRRRRRPEEAVAKVYSWFGHGQALCVLHILAGKAGKSFDKELFLAR